MKLFVVIYTASCVSFVHPHDCSGFFSKENSCNQITLDLIQDWVSSRPVPSLKTAMRLYAECGKAFQCTKSLECPGKNKEIYKKIVDLSEMCSGIFAFGSYFGACIPIIQSKQSSLDYPCLRHWNQRETPACAFFGMDLDCAEMFVENQCGTRALDEMRKNMRFINDFFGCSPPTPKPGVLELSH